MPLTAADRQRRYRERQNLKARAFDALPPPAPAARQLERKS